MLTRAAARLFVVGGCTEARENGALASLEEVQVKVGDKIEVIECKQHLRFPRRSPLVWAYDDSRIAVLGGCAAPGVHLASIEHISFEQLSHVSESLNIPGSSCAAFCAINSGCLMIGGYDGLQCLRDVLFFKYASDSIVVNVLPNFCSDLKNGVAIQSKEKEVLVFGGWDGSRTLSSIFRLTFTDDFSSYECSMAGVLCEPLEGHSATKFNDTIFIVGGFDGVKVTNKIWRFDIESNQLVEVNVKLSTARENHTCQIIGRKLLVIGGWNGAQSLDSIEVFDILDLFPFLQKVPCDARLRTPRNRPASVLV